MSSHAHLDSVQKELRAKPFGRISLGGRSTLPCGILSFIEELVKW